MDEIQKKINQEIDKQTNKRKNNNQALLKLI